MNEKTKRVLRIVAIIANALFLAMALIYGAYAIYNSFGDDFYMSLILFCLTAPSLVALLNLPEGKRDEDSLRSLSLKRDILEQKAKIKDLEEHLKEQEDK